MKVKLAGISKLELKKNHYVYGLIDPRDSTLFYIGQAYSCSKKPRYLQHFLTVKNTMQNVEKHKIIQEIKAAGYRTLLYCLFFETDNKKEAVDKEIELIAAYRPHITNVSRGGIGGRIWGDAHPLLGKTFSPEWRRKLSEAKKGKPSPRKGAVLSDATKEKIRQNTIKQLRENNPRLVKLTTEQIENILFLRSLGMKVEEIKEHVNLGKYIILRALGKRKLKYDSA